jgi:hypothetical protein
MGFREITCSTIEGARILVKSDAGDCVNECGRTVEQSLTVSNRHLLDTMSDYVGKV